MEALAGGVRAAEEKGGRKKAAPQKRDGIRDVGKAVPPLFRPSSL